MRIKIYSWLILSISLLISAPIMVFGDTVHIDTVEPSTEELINITTTGDTLNMQLSVAKKLGIGLLIVTVIAVLVGYKEPSEYGLTSVVHLKKADKKIMSETVRSSKKIPAALNETEVLALMYGIVDNKYLLLIGGIGELLKKGYIEIGGSEEDSAFILVEKPVKGKTTPKYELQLSDLLSEGCRLSKFMDFCKENKDGIDEFIDLYAKESLKSLHKQGKFARHIRIHKVDVYYPSGVTRQIMRDLNKLLVYFEKYGIPALETSTREEAIGDYGRLIVYLGLDLQPEKSEALRKSMEICSVVRAVAEELNHV